MKKMFLAVCIAACGFFFASCDKDTFVGLDDFTKEVSATNQEMNEETFPPEWGEIIAASISAIPADDERGEYDKKCLLIRTTVGAVTVPFSREKFLPQMEDIVASNFVKGDFDESYNSGFFDKKSGIWIPATAVDSKDRLEYRVDGVCKRNIRYNTLLSMAWDWQNQKDGYFSTQVTDYICQVENNTLSIFSNGNVIMRIR